MIPIKENLGFLIAWLLISSGVYCEPRQITIGGLFDLTSPAGSVWGQDERDGFILAIEDFNQSNTDLILKYEIDDSAYSNTKSVSAFQKLRSLNGVKYIIGPTWETFVATSPICEQQRVFCFSPSHYGPIFYDEKKPLRYSFTAFFDERGYSNVLADQMIRTGHKKVAVYSAISAYYDTLAAAFLARFTPKPVLFEKFDSELKDLRPLILKTPKDIDALYLILDPNGQNYLFLSQWLQLRKDKPVIYSHDGILYEPNWDKIKGFGFQFHVSKPFFEPKLETAWSDRFKKRFGRAPGAPSGVIAYDETMILAKCILSKGDQVAAVRDCVAETNNYVGHSGVISFNGGVAVTNRTYTIESIS